MHKVNKLDYMFGPAGTSAGIFIFGLGVLVTFFSLPGLILIVLGAFVGFTSSCTIIDAENKKIKFSNKIFGIFSVGKWLIIEPDMKIVLLKNKKIWRAYSRGNRTLDINTKDYRLFLYNGAGNRLGAIAKISDYGAAREYLEDLKKNLGLE